MRFLFLSLTAIPGSSGEGTRVYHLASSIARKGHEVTILTNVASHRFQVRSERHGDLRIITSFWPIAFFHLPCFLVHFVVCLRLIRSERIDVVQTESFISGLLGWLLKRITSAVFVADMHGPWIEEMQLGDNLDKKVILWRIALAMNNGILFNADYILVPNREMRDALEQAKDKVLVIPNGVDPTLFNGASARSGPTDGTRHGKGATVLMVTGWEAWVDFDVLITAARILSERARGIEFIVIGGGEEEVKVLQRKIDASGVKESFRLLGRVPHVDIPTFISRADICLALYSEIPAPTTLSGAMKLYEYAAMGKPIIASEFGRPPDILEEFVHTVTPGDGRGLASAILELMGGSHDLTRAAESVRVRCSWDKMVEPILTRLQGPIKQQ